MVAGSGEGAGTGMKNTGKTDGTRNVGLVGKVEK